MRGAAGVQPQQAPAVCSACFPPGRRESTRREGARDAGRRGRWPACQQATGWSDGAAPWLSPPGVPVSPRHKDVAWVEWPRVQLALLKAVGPAGESLGTRAPTGLTLPSLSFCYHHHVLLSPPKPARSLSAVVWAPLPREKAFTLFLPWTCRQTSLAPWHLAPARGPYLQREGLNELFRHVVRERPEESFLFSVRIYSLRGKAQGEQLRLVPTKRQRTRCISPVTYPPSPGALAAV